MLNTNGNSKPAASWGKVAMETLKHPWTAGAVDVGVGTFSLVVGTMTRDPVLLAGGAGLEAIGISRGRNFIKKLRCPTNDLH